MPISISPSPMVKVGLPTRGTVQGESATPMVRRLARACSAAADHLVEAAAGLGFAPATLKANTMPATPRRRAASSGGAEATSSRTSTVRTSISSIAAISAGHVEVHDVAAVVAVDVDDALAAMDAAVCTSSMVSAARRGEHVADGAAVQKAAAHVAEEHRQVARSAAGGERHLALHGRIGAHDRDRFAGEGELVGMRLHQSVKHLRRRSLPGD